MPASRAASPTSSPELAIVVTDGCINDKATPNQPYAKKNIVGILAGTLVLSLIFYFATIQPRLDGSHVNPDVQRQLDNAKRRLGIYQG